MGKVQLTLVRTWGDENEEDDNRIFKNPWDVVVGNNELIYICDFGKHRIQVFDNSGLFIRTLGTRGSGPSDLLNPNAITLDSQGNIIVSDQSNMRIQVLTLEGKYVGGFKFIDGWISNIQAAHHKDEIVLYSYKKTFFSRKLLFVYDKKGKLLREIGNYINTGKELTASESVLFTLDEYDNIYTAYYGTPYLLVFSYSGNILKLITYEMPYESPSPIVTLDKIKKSVQISGKAKGGAARAIYSDNKGRIFLVTPKRLHTEKEIKESTSYSIKNGAETIIRKMKMASENTDLYRLLVFNPSGKVIASSQLNVQCNKIYIRNDRLFIIDSEKALKIYEYKITFKLPY